MEIFEFGDRSARRILLQPVDGLELSLMDKEITAIREGTEGDFRLMAFKVNNWNNDLSPWKAPAVFGKEDFGGAAEDTLNEILKHCEDSSAEYYIGGYSLAGLFALWASYQSNLFKGVAAVSPSVWFPGFGDYMRDSEIKSGKVYLSLGNKEEKTRNPVTSTVGDRIREAQLLLKQQGVDCVLEWNEGNHFRDTDIRTARGFARLLNRSV